MKIDNKKPVKTVTAGEGGAIATNDEKLYHRLLRLRSHGITRNPDEMVHPTDAKWYNEQVELGYNYRMTDFQAALLLSQLDKLDFLMQAMIKTSRLEAGVIALEPKPQTIYDTLAAALGGILLNAEQKKIAVTVDCPETVTAAHDRKWTTEALFNILDNAVKYTAEGGKIHVAVVCWEMYVKIDISDTGIGIPEQHQGTIFKRFYREDRVHDAPGIGIGLYLAREIITRQGGFIRVASEVGSGSTFSVFLPHS